MSNRRPIVWIDDEGYVTYSGEDILEKARSEIYLEAFKGKVEEAKEKLLTKTPWHVKVFPWRIKFERVD